MSRESDKLLFFRKLHQLLGAGLRMRDILVGLQQSAGPESAARFQQVLQGLDAGLPLSEALSGIFPMSRAEESMLQAAQISGNLAGALDAIVRMANEKQAFRKELRRMLVKPVSTLLLALGVLSGVSFFVLPRIMESMPDATATPFYVQVLTWLGHGVPFAVAAAGLVGGGLAVLRIMDPLSYGRLIYRLPLFGRLQRFREFNTLFITLALMTQHGTRLATAMEISASEASPYFGQILQEVLQRLRGGDSLRGAFAAAAPGMLPFYVLELVDTAEKTGDYGRYFQEVGRMIDEDFQESRRMFLPVIEITAMAIVGLVVISVMLTLALPLQSMGDQIMGGGAGPAP